MPIERPLLLDSAVSGDLRLDLETKVKSALRARLDAHESYSRDEVEKVGKRNFRLLPEGYRISEDEEETLRALASRYRVSIRPAHAIRSHRKFIGPVIVHAKKLIWRVLDFFIKGTLEHMEDFQRVLIRSQARQMVEIRRLSTIVGELSADDRK